MTQGNYVVAAEYDESHRLVPLRSGSARHAAAIVPDDDTDIEVTRGVYVGGAGDLVVMLADDDEAVTLTGVAAGVIHPLRVKRVMEASTASALVAVY